ncbi:MAG: hypothetical protein HQL25_01560 [Candidatus Omnitrophica bacterium]|nr:hypothetical protein [Candidatus Omnitrophota bacterium]
MKNYQSRLKKLESEVGISEKIEYAILLNGYRTVENCFKANRLVFRCPNGEVRNVSAVYVVSAGKWMDILDLSDGNTKIILKNMGYEEIKSEEDLRFKLPNKSEAEINKILGRYGSKVVESALLEI